MCTYIFWAWINTCIIEQADLDITTLWYSFLSREPYESYLYLLILWYLCLFKARRVCIHIGHMSYMMNLHYFPKMWLRIVTSWKRTQLYFYFLIICIIFEGNAIVRYVHETVLSTTISLRRFFSTNRTLHNE